MDGGHVPSHARPQMQSDTGKKSGLAAWCFANWSLGSFGVLWLKDYHGKLELVGF